MDIAPPAQAQEGGAAGHRRAASLQPLTAALLECVTPADVVEAVVGRGVAVLGAEAGLVALVRSGDDPAQAYLEVVRARGYEDAVMTAWHRFPLAASLPLSDVVRERTPLLFTDRTDMERRYPDMFRQGPTHPVKASASLPLVARGRVLGGLHFSFPDTRGFSPADREFLDDLARQCALALDRALLLQEREEARARQEFLARASALLAESLDYQTTLESIARLAVPALCDWVTVDMLAPPAGGDGAPAVLTLAVAAHVDPAEVEALRELRRRSPITLDQTGQPPVRAVLTGETVFLPEITPEMTAASVQDAEQRRHVGRLGLRSLVSVPLRTATAAAPLGALTFVAVRASGRAFTPDTVALAEELARRAAVAIDNARLFGAAQTARQQTELVLDSINEMFYAVDAQFRFTYANRRAQEFWGKRLEALRGCGLWEEFPALVGTEAHRRLTEAMRTRRALSFESVSVVSGRWVECSAYPAEDGGLAVYFRDVHDRREAQEELARREAEYAALVDNAPDILTRFGADLRVQYISRAAERYVGVPRAELIGKTVAEIAGDSSEATERWDDALRRAFRTGAPVRIEFDAPLPTGGTYHFEASLTPERDKAGKVVSVIALTHDISDRVAGERALREAARRQRRFLREMLLGFTEGRLHLCFTPDELPPTLPPQAEPLEVSEATLRPLRKQIEVVAERIGLPPERVSDFVTACHEAAMNAVRHAGGGAARVHADPEAGRMQVWVTDHGPGIAEELIHRAVERGFTTGGFGQGFFYMQSNTDRLYLLTGRQGTTVVLEQGRAAPSPAWFSATDANGTKGGTDA